MKRLAAVLVLWFGLTVGLPARAEAPRFELLGPIGIIHADELIPVDVRMTTGGTIINAAEVTLRFPADQLRVDHIQREQTVFELWPEAPAWDNTNGTAHFVGGHPNGLVAIGAKIATVYFRAQRTGSVTITLEADGSGLYRNDGAGTKVAVTDVTLSLNLRDALVSGIALTSTTHPASDQWSSQATIVVAWSPQPNTQYSYALSTDSQVPPDDTPEQTNGQATFTNLEDGRYYFSIKALGSDRRWSEVTQRRFLIDTQPPEPFTLMHPDPATVGGHELLTWVTTDATSGIDHATLTVGNRLVGTVSSPLTLRPEWNGQDLTIAVFDQAGNQQSARWSGGLSRPWPWWMPAVGAGLLIGVAGGFWLRRRR